MYASLFLVAVFAATALSQTTLVAIGQISDGQIQAPTETTFEPPCTTPINMPTDCTSMSPVDTPWEIWTTIPAMTTTAPVWTSDIPTTFWTTSYIPSTTLGTTSTGAPPFKPVTLSSTTTSITRTTTRATTTSSSTTTTPPSTTITTSVLPSVTQGSEAALSRVTGTGLALVVLGFLFSWL